LNTDDITAAAANKTTIKLTHGASDAADRLKTRADRFGVVTTEQEASAPPINKGRSKRKGAAGSSAAGTGATTDMSKQRVERFGLPLKGSKAAKVLQEDRATVHETTPEAQKEEEEKKRQRAIRFGKDNTQLEEKQKRRMERFQPKPAAPQEHEENNGKQ